VLLLFRDCFSKSDGFEPSRGILIYGCRLAADWKAVIREHLFDIFEGGALFIVVYGDFSVVEIGPGVKYAVNIFQD